MAYGIKYKCEFTSSLGKSLKAYILKKDYNSAQINLRMSGDPIKINYLGSENKYDIIRGSECILEFFSEYDGQFSEIMTADAMEFQVQIWKDGFMLWQGYVIQDNYSEPFNAAPYLISIRATDGLGNLKHHDFVADDTSFYLSDMTFIEVIQKCLAKLKNGTQVVTSNDVFESRINRSDINNESFNSIKANPYLFVEDDLTALKCDVVLEYLLEVFGCYIYYNQGKYFIERLNYKVNDVITRRYYNINFDGTYSAVVSVSNDNIRKQVSRTSGLRLVNNDGNITYTTPFNKVQVDSDVVTVENIIANSFFRNWNTVTNIPYNWVKSGTLDIEKINFPLSGDAIQVNTKTADAALSYTTNKLISQKVNFNGLSLGANKLSIRFASFGNARFLVKASTINKSYYLECATEVIENKLTFIGMWKEYPTFCRIERGTGSRSENYDADSTGNWYVSEINDMNIPASIVSLEFSLLPSYDTDKYKLGFRVREFTPRITTSESTDIQGQRHSLQSNKNNQETYNELTPVLGEFGNLTLVNQISINGLVTSNWYRDGKTEAEPLLKLACKSILNQYRTAFRQFSGSLYGDFNFGSVYQISGLSGIHMPFKASISLKRDTTEVEFFELLPDADDVNDKYQKVTNYKNSGYRTMTDMQNVNRPRTSGNLRPGRG